MGTLSPPRRPFAARLLAALLAVTFAVTAVGWLSAQNSKKEEEEETVKPKKKPPVVEEEEDRPARRPKVIKVEDDDPAPSKPRPHLQLPPPEEPSSLDEAVEKATNPALRAFLKKWKETEPHDLLTVRNNITDEVRIRPIEPLPDYYADPQPKFKDGSIKVREFDAKWRASKDRMEYHTALRVQPYEEVVLDAVDEFLKEKADRLKTTRAEMLGAAVAVLAKANRDYASALATGKHLGDEWKPVGKRLHERLFDVRLQLLKTFRADGDWDGATAYAGTLVRAYREPEEHASIAAPLVSMIEDGLPRGASDEQLRQARDHFQLLEEIFGGSQAIQPISGSLREQAQRLLDEAKSTKDKSKARKLTELAAKISSNLPDLPEELARMDQDHPVLRVGVRELPVKMIPGQAVTDADLRAVELMYEGLVKLREEPGVGQAYEPGLAEAPPRLIPLGREFSISPRACWTDGTPVTVGDVKETLRAMKQQERQPRWVGFSPLWNGMVEEVEGGGGNSLSLSVRLRQGYLDPLSLMTFKIMSQASLRQGAAPDAKPAGSGPFRLKADNQEPYTVKFIANPAYADRKGKLGLPRIKEIHFLQLADGPDEGEKALKEGHIDLLLDPDAKQAKALRLAGKAEVRGPMPTRRVYFLAVNHRDARINGNVALRRALALAIDRQTILDKYFRAEPGAKTHHSLNGPFPAGSWPCEKKVPAELYNSAEAKAQAREAVEKAGAAIELKVKYPAGDPATHGALKALCEAVSNELRIDDKTYVKLELQEPAVEPHQLRRDVEEAHEYEVAYYHYDHPSKAYWVAPLFDMRAEATDVNGSNYLGYIDPELQAEFEKAKNHRDFSEVQQTMHLVHRLLVQKMPLIPLWQLDTFLAYRPGVDLKDAAVDPLLIFNDVEKWKLEAKRN